MRALKSGSINIFGAGAGIAALLLTSLAAAQGNDPAGAGSISGSDTSSVVTAPVLKTHPEATYPEEAKRDRIEGTVGLELSIDDLGKVTAVKVLSPAGHGLDEAAVAAAREFTFEPARRAGNAVPATIQFGYEFHLPPAPVTPPAPVATTPTEPVAPPPIVEPAPDPTQTGADQATLVLAQRPISAASAFSVRDREFQLRPIGSVQDILRVTPGLVVVQHSGGGKANQYFLRGFDADHGTDIAMSIDGIPINMVSHGHGQGYTDTNFIIPETIERVEITKGPYFAEQGDFATAGAVNFVTRKDFEHTSLGFGGGGSPGYGGPSLRGLLIASPKFEKLRPMFVAEVGRQDGPFDNPEGWNKYKLFNKISYDISPTSTISLGEASYAGDWHGSGQIPQRALASGKITRYGTIDPTEGGNTSRHQAFVAYKIRPTEKSELNALAYLAQYRFNLYSNFTLYQRDPDNGDQIEQKDRRVFYGGKLSYRVVNEIGGVRFDTTMGGNARSDDISQELNNTRERQLLGAVGSNRTHETMVGGFVKEEVVPTKWARFVVGGRADFIGVAVDTPLQVPNDPKGATSGVKGASQMSPKGSIVLTPLETGIGSDDLRKNFQWDLYVNYGQGFHSNDARGMVVAQNPVTPLSRAIGSEVGTRTRLFNRLDFAASLWQLNLESETVWIGDEGRTEPSDRTHREGIELETRYELTNWLSADLDVTFTKSGFVQNAGNGNGLALAPKQTWSGGVSARHPSGFRGGLRFFGIGDRPATDDNELIATGFTQFDLHAGYRHRWFDVALDVENLFNGKFRSAQFATTGRLRDEPSQNAPPPTGTCGNGSRLAPLNNGNFAGCEDIHLTPAYPLTVRLMTTFYLD